MSEAKSDNVAATAMPESSPPKKKVKLTSTNCSEGDVACPRLSSAAEVDNNGTTPDVESLATSVLKTKAVEDLSAACADTSDDQASNSQPIATEVIDFAYAPGGDDHSATSSMTEVCQPDVTVEVGHVQMSPGLADTCPNNSVRQSEGRSLRGDSFKFPGESVEIVDTVSESRYSQGPAANAKVKVMDEDADSADDQINMSIESYAPSNQSSCYSLNAAAQLTPVQGSPSLLPVGTISAASFIHPLQNKMEPRQEPRSQFQKPKPDLLQCDDCHHEYMLANEMKRPKKKIEKPGVRLEPFDIIFYMQQCHLV
jgi:hypothetical protein